MALRLPAISGIVPLVLVVLLATMNSAVLISGFTSEEDSGLWEGALMPGKRFALPDPATAKIVQATGERIVPAQANKPQQLKVAKPVVASKAPVKPAVVSSKFIVHLGQFTSKEGVAPLVDRLRNQGYNPRVRAIEEKVLRNSVQAGPFSSLESAREAEVKLRASGLDVWVTPGEEGYVIPLVETINLSDAIFEMDRIEAMGVSPLKLIKVEAKEQIHMVFMGPYNSKAKAQEVSDRMSTIGLAIPKIESWESGS
ncbi:MAG: SPOR domain-containing protein [Magnetococcales bacterium]|nr:SPOR domain-containing protein [Magnetococcales bacterium]